METLRVIVRFITNTVITVLIVGGAFVMIGAFGELDKAKALGQSINNMDFYWPVVKTLAGVLLVMIGHYLAFSIYGDDYLSRFSQKKRVSK